MNAEGNQGRTDGLKARNVRPIIEKLQTLIYLHFTFYISNSIVAVATAQVNTKIYRFPTIRENRGVFNLNISNHTI